jgi:nitrite reductase (NO-forming)
MRFVFPALVIVAVVLGLAALVAHSPISRVAPTPGMSSEPNPPAPAATTAATPTAQSPPAVARPAPASATAAGPAPTTAAQFSQSQATTSNGHPMPGMSPSMPGMGQGRNHMAAALGASSMPPSQVGAQTAAAADVEEGRKVFRKCQACHSLQAGKQLVGPSLAGIIGKKSGTEPGFNYAPAMKQANITWNAETLSA